MGFWKFIGICVGGTLFCVGVTVYYTCKLTGYLIFYTCKYAYLGTSWCVRKIYNYYYTGGDSTVLVRQPSNTGYSVLNTNDYHNYGTSTSRNNYDSVNVSSTINRVVSASNNTGNNNATVSRNATATTRTYLGDNAIDTSNRVVSGYATTSHDVGRVPAKRNNVTNIHASVTTTPNYLNGNGVSTSNRIVSNQASNNYDRTHEYAPVHTNNSDSSVINHNVNTVRATAREKKRSRDAGHVPVPVHKQEIYKKHICFAIARNNVKYDIVDETYDRQDPSSSNWRSKGRSNSRDPNKGQKEYRIPTSDVLMPTGRTVAVTIPSKPHCNCKQLSATKLIPLWPKSKMGSREYNIVSDEMNHTIRQHNSGTYSGYHIVSVHKVKNCCLWTKFQNRQMDIGKETNNVVNQRMLFHGSAAVDHIVRMGFDERRSNQNGLFGAGVYFAEHSSKSNQYVFGLGSSCPLHSRTNCPLCVRKMLLCRVTMGTIHYLRNSTKMAHSPPGFHSVAGIPSTSGLQYPEYIIYRGEQAYPEYLITYRIRL